VEEIDDKGRIFEARVDGEGGPGIGEWCRPDIEGISEAVVRTAPGFFGDEPGGAIVRMTTEARRPCFCNS